LSEEHIIGQQFIKELALPGPFQHRVDGKAVGRPKNVLNITLDKRVCEKCNNEWMARMDDAVIEMLRPSLRLDDLTGPISLDPASQRTVATWGVKIALLYALAMHDDGHLDTWVPHNHFHDLYAARRPPLKSQVWLSQVEVGPVPSPYAFAGHVALDGLRFAYNVLFTIGHLVVYVLGWSNVYGQTERVQQLFPYTPPVEITDALLPVWKRRDLVAYWPPGKAIKRDRLWVVANAIRLEAEAANAADDPI
jgi:hypothetical protein